MYLPFSSKHCLFTSLKKHVLSFLNKTNFDTEQIPTIKLTRYVYLTSNNKLFSINQQRTHKIVSRTETLIKLFVVSTGNILRGMELYVNQKTKEWEIKLIPT